MAQEPQFADVVPPEGARRGRMPRLHGEHHHLLRGAAIGAGALGLVAAGGALAGSCDHQGTPSRENVVLEFNNICSDNGQQQTLPAGMPAAFTVDAGRLSGGVAASPGTATTGTGTATTGAGTGTTGAGTGTTGGLNPGTPPIGGGGTTTTPGDNGPGGGGEGGPGGGHHHGGGGVGGGGTGTGTGVGVGVGTGGNGTGVGTGGTGVGTGGSATGGSVTGGNTTAVGTGGNASANNHVTIVNRIVRGRGGRPVIVEVPVPSGGGGGGVAYGGSGGGGGVAYGGSGGSSGGGGGGVSGGGSSSSSSVSTSDSGNVVEIGGSTYVRVDSRSYRRVCNVPIAINVYSPRANAQAGGANVSGGPTNVIDAKTSSRNGLGH